MGINVPLSANLTLWNPVDADALQPKSSEQKLDPAAFLCPGRASVTLRPAQLL